MPITKTENLGQSARQWRRRSADVGGLHLATGNSGQGQGWIGYSGELQYFAELLSDMYTQTLHAVQQENDPSFIPTDLSPDTRSDLIRKLDCWGFEPHKLSEEEVLSCTLILFEALFRIEGMEEAVGISLGQISSFVHHLRQIYRFENSYHNFEHALDVLQASQSYLRSAGMVPPLSILLIPGLKWKPQRAFNSGPLITTLGLPELFALYIVAIGHDVGHPGFTNLFMKNAETPLSIVFDGKSALEQMHYQLLLRVMRCHGLGSLLDSPANGMHIRKLLWQTVLATDMSVHDQFMRNFKDIIDGQLGSLCIRQVIVCQAIMKNADISNPSRPYPVSQHWATALMKEWTSQAVLEKNLDLPATVQPSDNPLVEAKSQVFFINTFAKPLLDLTVRAVPEMKTYADTCAANLNSWSTRCTELQAQKIEIPPPITHPRHPDDYMSAFPLTLPPSHRTPQTDDHTLIWPAAIYSQSPGSSSGSSESNPCSPTESVSSFIFSPVSDTSNPRPPSSAGSSGSGASHLNGSLLVPDGHAAIRAAGQLGIRKQKSMNRNSWSPYSTAGQPRVAAAVALLVSTDATTPILAPEKPSASTIVVKPITFEKSKLSK
ncbi:hypothetical protein BDZ94DRAFT_1155311 [Collybia nuda]|uniref:Phosphodiesterase n=1 Tax=Collybia nuda TaxID=64659 RepID=A0A9P6CMZ7_9AGAR|nr:hypothetical protein BDZ94DRAFT_1155311 [Collybia nuda]